MIVAPLRKLLDPRRPLTYGIVQAGPNFEGGTPYIRPTDMTETLGVADESQLLRTSPDIAAAYERASLRAGDIVLSIGPSYGKVMVVPPSLDGANLTQGTARLAPGAGVFGRWLYWVLQARTLTAFWGAVAAGGTFRALNLGPLGETPIPVTPSSEQRRIADFLDDRVARIDQIIAARKSQIECNQEQFSSAMDERLEQVPDRVRASRVLRVLPGLAFPSEEFSHDPADIPLLRGINVGVGALRWDDTVYWPPQRLDEVRAFVLSEGDVVMGMDRPWVGAGLRIARVTAGDGSPLLLQRVAKLSPSHALVASYTYWAYQSSRFREQVESALTGLSVPHLSGEQILGYQLPICSLEKQREISDCLEVLSAAMLHADAALTSSIDLLIEYRQSLITAAVTGELDVTTAGSGIPR